MVVQCEVMYDWMVVCRCLRFLVIFLLVMFSDGMKCSMFGLVCSVSSFLLVVWFRIVLVWLVKLWFSIVFSIRFWLCIWLNILNLLLIWFRLLCSVCDWWFMLWLIFGEDSLCNVMCVIVVVSGLLLKVVLCVLNCMILVIFGLVSIVLIGNLLFNVLVRVMMFGLMLFCQCVNSVLVWFMLIWILFSIISVLCWLQRLWMCCMKFGLVGIILFLFWIGFSIIVVMLLVVIVVFSCILLLKLIQWKLFGNGLQFFWYFGWVVVVIVVRVWLWKLLWKVMMMCWWVGWFCEDVYLCISLIVILLVLVLELYRNMCLVKCEVVISFLVRCSGGLLQNMLLVCQSLLVCLISVVVRFGLLWFSLYMVMLVVRLMNLCFWVFYMCVFWLCLSIIWCGLYIGRQ